MPPIDVVQLSPADAQGKWGEDLRIAAIEALKIAQERLGLDLDAPPIVESFSPEKAFYARLGERPHHLVAVAIAAENRIIVNRSRFYETAAGERRATLVHEVSHLIVGRRVPGGVPRWLDEGLAMVAARESGFGFHTRLAFAASFGRILSLDDAWGRGDASQDLAYAESLSATRYFLETYGSRRADEADNLREVARRLADAEGGRPMRTLIHDRIFMEAFERRWRDSLRSVWTLISALTGGGALWGLLALAIVLAYWRQRRMARLKEAEWEAEDRAEEQANGELDYTAYDEDAMETLGDLLSDEDEGEEWKEGRPRRRGRR